MPVSYLDVPEGLDAASKQHLVKRLYDALHRAYPFPDDVRIFIREWPPDSVSQNGLIASEPARPVLTMNVPQGVESEARRTMLKEISDAVAEAYHLASFMIFIDEYPLDRVALDGILHADNAQRVKRQRSIYRG